MLPPEILDKIFSFLATDQASLEACSNAHPAILQLVERYLYCNVVIGNENLKASHGFISPEWNEFLGLHCPSPF